MNYLIRSAKNTSNNWIEACVEEHTNIQCITATLRGQDDVPTLVSELTEAAAQKQPYHLLLNIEPRHENQHDSIVYVLMQLFLQRELSGIELHPDTKVLVVCPCSSLNSTPLMDGNLVRASALLDLEQAPGEIDRMQDMLKEALDYQTLEDYHDTLLHDRRLGVVVIQMVDDDEMDADDEGLEGIYEVNTHEPMPDFMAYQMAYESFHNWIPVSSLESFEFEVFDLDSKNHWKVWGLK